MRTKLFSSMFFLFFSLECYCADSSRDLNRSTEVLENDLVKLKASMRTLDQKIASQNSLYIEKIQKLQLAQEAIARLAQRNHENKKKIKDSYKKVQRKLHLHALSYDSHNSVEDQLMRRSLTQQLDSEIKALALLLKRNDEMILSLDSLKKQTEDQRQSQQIVYDMLKKLEEDKNKISNRYFENLKVIEENEKIALRKKLELEMEKSLAGIDDGSFSHPLESFDAYHFDDKALKYSVRGQANIKAAKDGKVVYTGDLASFGKVVMIEHEQDYRSVLLGHFELEVIVGEQVRRGNKIGRFSHQHKKNTLHFEVRKKETVQDIKKFIQIL